MSVGSICFILLVSFIIPLLRFCLDYPSIVRVGCCKFTGNSTLLRTAVNTPGIQQEGKVGAERESSLCGSGSAGLMKEGREVVGQWRLLRVAESTTENSAGREDGCIKGVPFYFIEEIISCKGDSIFFC